MADDAKTIDPALRYSRQKDLVPAERMAGCRITIIGVGAIGRQVALQLAAMGAPSLQLVDFDTVDESNLASQGYLQDDLGRPKVEATGDLCHQIHHQLEVIQANERFRRSMEIGNVLLCCVDSIATRRLIWEAVKAKVSVFVDTRMSAEVVRVLAAADEPSRQHYPTTLFAAEEAFSGSCTAKSTLYTANIAAGLAIGQFTRWLRGLPIDADLSLNLLTSELTVG
jgi:sulfur carrier protein ThiS adenylyltransferase